VRHFRVPGPRPRARPRAPGPESQWGLGGEGGEAEGGAVEEQEPLVGRNVRRSRALFRALTAWFPRPNPRPGARNQSPAPDTPSATTTTTSSGGAGAAEQTATGVPAGGAPLVLLPQLMTRVSRSQEMRRVLVQKVQRAWEQRVRGAEASAGLGLGPVYGDWGRLLGAAAEATVPPSLATVLRSPWRRTRAPGGRPSQEPQQPRGWQQRHLSHRHKWPGHRHRHRRGGSDGCRQRGGATRWQAGSEGQRQCQWGQHRDGHPGYAGVLGGHQSGGQ